MSVLWVGVATSVVMGAANMAAGKKRAKAQNEAMKEAAYVEGSAPIIPDSNQLEIETIGDAPSGAEGAAPDFREALEGSYGGGIYDTQEFGSGPQQEIPPELEELLMMQQSSGQDPTNVQFANSGGPVGLPQDVYNFPVEKISQMQMDVDPGVRNVGNAMMAQMEANPGMGMVGASAADIDQMAAGGPVRPKKYQDGSEGGLRGYLSMDEMPEDATEYDKQMQRELIATELGRNNNIVELLDLYNSTAPSKESIFSEEIQYVEDPETGDIIPTMRGYMSPLTGSSREFYQSLQDVEQSTQSGKALTDRDREMLGLPMATGGPVQPRRYDDGGVIQEAIVDTVTDQIPGAAQFKILQAIKQTDDPEEKRRLARQLIPGYGLGEMGAQGVKALGRKIKERPRMRAWRARRRGEGIPEFGRR